MKQTAIFAGVLVSALCGVVSLAEAFEATRFRVAASSAPVILVGKVSRGREGARIFNVKRTIRGQSNRALIFNQRQGGFHGSMDIGSTYIVLLSTDGKPFETIVSGVSRDGKLFEQEYECGTVNALKIVDGMVANPQDFEWKWNDQASSPLRLSEVEKLLRMEQK